MKNLHRSTLILPVLVCVVTITLIYFILTHRETVQPVPDNVNYKVTKSIANGKNIIPVPNPELDEDIEESKVINEDIKDNLKLIDVHVNDTKVFIKEVSKDTDTISRGIDAANDTLKKEVTKPK